MTYSHQFSNFIPSPTRFLILGSFTSNQFTKDAGYDWFYGTKRNYFWPIIEEVYNTTLDTKKVRQELFTQIQMGIGDIIYQCERKDGNSSDTNLINIIYNTELESILDNNTIESIFFTSRYVEKLYKKVFSSLIKKYPLIRLITLPSPSPRYAAMTKERKIEIYKEKLPKVKRYPNYSFSFPEMNG